MTAFAIHANHPEHGYVVARVEADNKREAMTYAKAQLSIREMSVAEVVSCTKRGIAIVDAKTGQLVEHEDVAYPSTEVAQA